MTAAGHFDWRTLGKADYAQASAIVSSLPEDVRVKLTGVGREILVRILHLSWTFGERSGRGVGYCWPTLRTLAKYCARSERTVERHLLRLASLGLIKYKWRTTRTGAWTSNLYQAGKVVLASLFTRTKKKVQSFRAPTKVSDNDLTKGYKASAPVRTGERLTDILGLPRQQPNQPLGAASLELATDGWED